jgi:hypothetical protein
MVRLVRAELHLMDAALAGDEALAEALGHDVVPGWATLTGRRGGMALLARETLTRRGDR